MRKLLISTTSCPICSRISRCPCGKPLAFRPAAPWFEALPPGRLSRKHYLHNSGKPEAFRKGRGKAAFNAFESLIGRHKNARSVFAWTASYAKIPNLKSAF